MKNSYDVEAQMKQAAYQAQFGNAGVTGIGPIGPSTQSNQSMIDSASNMTGECLAAVHELNQRLRTCGDRVSGSMPSPVETNSGKQAMQPCLLETLRYLRGALQVAHEEVARLERGI